MTDENEKIRKGGIGSSEIAAIMGLSPWSDPYTIWTTKLPPEHEAYHKEDKSDNMAIQRGIYLEPAIIQWYQAITGNIVHDAGTRYWKDNTVIRDRADGIVYMHGAPAGCLEVKTTDPMLTKAWGNPEDGDEAIPVYYYVQAIWHCGVWGLPWCDVPLFAGRDLKIYRAHFEPNVFDHAVRMALKFWNDYVIPQVEPEAGPVDQTAKQFALRWPQNNGHYLDPTPESEEWARKYIELQKQISDLESEKSAIQNKLKQSIGEADGIRGTDFQISWKRSRDSQVFDSKAFLASGFMSEKELAQFWTTREGTRRFVAK